MIPLPNIEIKWQRINFFNQNKKINQSISTFTIKTSLKQFQEKLALLQEHNFTTV